MAARRLRADPNAGGYSTIPLVFGLLGCLGFATSPIQWLNDYWWIPLVIDPVMPMLACLLFVRLPRAMLVRLRRSHDKE